MAEGVIPMSASTSTIGLSYNNLINCAQYPKFKNFGWETLYKNYKTNFIEILHIYSDISRLYLLIKLDLSLNILTDTISALRIEKINTCSKAVKLTNDLKAILPDADPIYLEIVGEMFAFDESRVDQLVNDIITKKRSYPKVEKNNGFVEISKILNGLMINFKTSEFLSICPDPINFFNSIKVNSIYNHFHESLAYLNKKFNTLSMATLYTKLDAHKFNLSNTVESINNSYGYSKLKHCICIDFKSTYNIEFLKEMIYIEHHDEIRTQLQLEHDARQIKIEKAKSIGELKSCECCYNDELLTTEVHCCPAGHYFCSSCIKKGVEVAVSERKFEFICFANCAEEFGLSMIEKIIDNKLYQYIMRQKQAQEIRAANIEGLETCAFCDYSVILSPEHRVISCLNPECKKETCRVCRIESHFPYKCHQFENASEAQARIIIENKMNEALIRTCYNCNRTFIKESGCNLMTCFCNKRMCYICREPLTSSKFSIKHFYIEKKIEENRCPLFTDENLVHVTAVEAAARLTVNKLKAEKPEFVKNIDIDNMLPTPSKFTEDQIIQIELDSTDVNTLVAKITGEAVKDINKLKDMRPLELEKKE